MAAKRLVQNDRGGFLVFISEKSNDELVITWHKPAKAVRVCFTAEQYAANLQRVLEHNMGLKQHPFLASLAADAATGAFLRMDADGDLIEIAFRIDAWVNNGGYLNRLNWRVNGIDATIYNVANSFYNYMFTSGSSIKSQYPILRLHFIGKELNYFILDKYKNSSDVYGQNLYIGITLGLNAETIMAINFFTNLSTSLIPAGTEIIIKKL